jgi:hypothetical protein
MNDDVSKSIKKPASCRGCNQPMKGDDYMYGNNIYNHKVNHYGGYVCSYDCDKRASLELERSMPGHSWNDTRLGCYSQRSLDNNWN